MKKHFKILSICILLVMIICIAGCSKEDDTKTSETTNTKHASRDELVGKWKGTGKELSTITLGKDGSYKDVVDDISVIGTYTVDSTAGTLTVNESEYGMVFTYSYELSGDNLTLQLNGGIPRTFTKQK
ncbi:MAG: hypothetical protein K6E47_01620 [Lachnospiraceae bacterium]|nr:hypothetical protein [Lachnospiraceae bacterium]